jgi:hypothetical protein
LALRVLRAEVLGKKEDDGDFLMGEERTRTSAEMTAESRIVASTILRD